jgi:hypothetical protein
MTARCEAFEGQDQEKDEVCLLSGMTARCEALEDQDHEYPDGYTEPERFFQCLEYHRSLLDDYKRRWVDDEKKNTASASPSSSSSWPKKIPTAPEIRPLELDLRFCQRSPVSGKKGDLFFPINLSSKLCSLRSLHSKLCSLRSLRSIALL